MKLRVEGSYTRDVGKPVARISPLLLPDRQPCHNIKIDLPYYSYRIKITHAEKHIHANLVYLYPHEDNLLIIRMDSRIRDMLGVKIGDLVKVEFE